MMKTTDDLLEDIALKKKKACVWKIFFLIDAKVTYKKVQPVSLICL